MDEFQDLLETDNPVLRIQKASHLMDEHRLAISRLATIRGQALIDLRRGHSVAWIADQLGVTRQQVHRLLREALGREHYREAEEHEA